MGLQVDPLSPEMGPRRTAQKIACQYGTSGLINDIIRGAAAVRMEATRTIDLAQTLWTIKPVVILVMTPMMTFGRKRMEVSIGDNPWTSWKLRSKSDQDALSNHAVQGCHAIINHLWTAGIHINKMTHKRLENNSNVVKTAHAKKTIMQMEVKPLFFQRRFGINAGFPSRS